MRAVLKTLDPVVLNFAANLLSQEGIESVVFDTHASVMDGSMGFLPRRLMVLDEDFAAARGIARGDVILPHMRSISGGGTAAALALRRGRGQSRERNIP
jgi:hypothetical protein